MKSFYSHASSFLFAVILLSVVWTGTPVGAQGSVDPREIPNLPDPVTVADYNLPPQDANGWTVLTCSPDSRLVYVDPVNGNDSTASFYLPDHPSIGADPRHPVGAIIAYRSLSAAKAQTRNNQPDWMLLKAGGVWTGSSLSVNSGQSPSRRSVITSYGHGPRPELRTGNQKGISNVAMSNIIIKGIKFWAHTRDIGSPYFVDYSGENGIHLYTRETGDPRVVRDILIEDCVFRAYKNNVLTGKWAGYSPIERFALRRSIVSGNYPVTAASNDHSQGLFHSGEGQPPHVSVLLQECVFDHNGWRLPVSAENDGKVSVATIKNHNTYFENTRGVLFDGNMFLRGSSMGTKWTANSGPNSSSNIVLQINLFADGELGLSMGGNDFDARRFHNIRIRDNVFTEIGRSRPTNRTLSWGMEIRDWDLGAITGNLVAHQVNPAVDLTYGIALDAPFQQRDVYVADNIIANLHSKWVLFQLNDAGKTSNVLVENNVVQANANTPVVNFTPGGYTITGTNRYFSTAPEDSRFQVSGSLVGLQTWMATSGDAGAVFEAPDFPDPTRTLGGYAIHLGIGSTLEDLIEAVYEQSEANWNPALTAPAINDWMRAGFFRPESESFESWIEAQNLGPTADTTPLGVNNAAGVPNLLAYAMDVHPGAEDVGRHLPYPELNAGAFDFIVRQRSNDPGLDYSLEGSSDLETWSPVEVEGTPIGNPAAHVRQIRYRFSVDDVSDPLFLRLRVAAE